MPPLQLGGTAERRKRSEAEGIEESECRSKSDEAGEPPRGTPLSKGRHWENGTVGGNDGRDTVP